MFFIRSVSGAPSSVHVFCNTVRSCITNNCTALSTVVLADVVTSVIPCPRVVDEQPAQQNAGIKMLAAF